MRSWAGRLLIPGLIGTIVAGCGGVEVSGIVRDRDTGEPLPGAIVGIGDQVTRTDPGGNYALEVDIDDDERPVRAFANAPGYRASTEFMGAQGDRDEMYRDFELTKRPDRQQQELQEQRRQQELWQQQRSAAQDRQGQPAADITTDEAGAIIIVPKAKQDEPQRFEGTLELRPTEEEQPQGQQGPEQQQQQQELQELQEQQEQQEPSLDEEQDLQQDDEGAFESR